MLHPLPMRITPAALRQTAASWYGNSHAKSCTFVPAALSPSAMDWIVKTGDARAKVSPGGSPPVSASLRRGDYPHNVHAGK